MRASLLVVVAALGCSSPPLSIPTGSIAGTVTVGSETDVSAVVLSLAGPTSGAARASAAGAYTLEHLADGTYAVTASAPSTAPSSITISATVSGGAATTADPLRLTPVGALTGKVTLAGAANGNGGTLVFLDGTGFSASTDDTGAWSLTGVPVGSYGVRASHAGFQSAATPPATVAWNTSRAAMDLDLQENLSFRGEIRGVAELVGLGPSEGIAVSVPGTSLSAVTSDAGTFVITGVSEGVLPLDLALGPYRAHLPSVLSLPGGAGFVVGDDGLSPLLPLELQRGDRIAVDSQSTTVVSPDGQRVIFLSRQPGTFICDLLTLTSSGGPVVPLANNVRCQAIFSPDSRDVFFSTFTGDTFTLPASGGTARHVSPNSVSSIAFAPGGHRAALISSSNAVNNQPRLEIYDLDAGTLTVLTNRLAGYAAPQFTRDASKALFVESVGGGSTGTLALGDTVTGIVQPISPDIVTAARFLPDESRVYYVTYVYPTSSDGILKVVPLDGGPVSVIDSHVCSDTFDTQLSSSGGELAYRADAGPPNYDIGMVVIAPLDGGAHRAVAPALRLRPVPGGTHFVFYQSSFPYGTWAAPFASGPPALLFTTQYYGGEHFTPDGQRAVTQDGNSTGQTLKSRFIDGGGGMTLSTTMLDNPVYSPDGGSVLFREVSADGGSVNLRLVDLASGNARTLGGDVNNVAESAFSRDGTRLIWTDAHGGLFTALESGGAAMQLASAVIVGNASLSPDGRTVQWLEVDPPTQSYRVVFGPAAGGPPVTALSHLWQYNFTVMNPYAPRLFPVWLGNDFYLAARAETPSPYRFQDGWYLLPVR